MLLLEGPPASALANIGYLIARYGHVVASMLLIGGLLFHEMVVPLALADEKEESQRAIFARARWSFQRIGWGCIILILLSGAVMSSARLPSYLHQEYFGGETLTGIVGRPLPMGLRTGWWWVAHTSAGVMALVIAIYVLSSTRPLAHPITWLRLDLMVLLVVVFLGSVTHYVDLLHLTHTSRLERQGYPIESVMSSRIAPAPAATAPAEEHEQ